MRGDLALTARLLLRRTGLAGACAALGGLLAMGAAMLPWWVVVSTVSTLGRSGERIAATLAGVPGTWTGWAVVVLGAAAGVVAGGMAIDRPLPHARGTLLLIAGLLAVLAVGSILFVPGLEHVAAADAPAIRALDDILPTGVEVVWGVRSGSGPYVLGAAALMTGVSAALVREP